MSDELPTVDEFIFAWFNDCDPDEMRECLRAFDERYGCEEPVKPTPTQGKTHDR